MILAECPVAYISRESEHLVLLFLACRSLHAPPYAAGLLHWPARLVDALLLLEQESAKADA